MNRKSNIFAVWVILGLVILFFLVYQTPAVSIKLPYSDFKNLIKVGAVSSVVLGADEIEVTLKPDANIDATGIPADAKEKIRKNDIKTIKVNSIPVDDKSLVEELEKNGISYRGEKTDQILPFLFSWILPIALIVGFWVFMMRRAQKSQGGVFAFGKSKVRIYRENDVKTTFKDVAGVDEAKEELQEIIEYLKSPQKYVHIGAKIPKGVLLVGPPGTGKTLLARAVAGEAKVSFFSISGPEFVEMFVGVGAARVRDLFEQALKSAPCIIFIDELDALGKSRGVNISGGNEEREQTLNQLLVEMDGFETNKGVVIMAATNRPEILDIALLRPGRFDRQVLVDRPDRRGREEILRVHIKGVKLGADVDITKVAQKTPGFVGADLANLVNEAALLAARKNQKEVAMANFDEAVERVIAGLEKKNRIITEKERKIIAYHEVGHALVAESLPNQDKVHKISIVPRGLSALGYTIQLPTEDRYLMTRSELNDKLCVLLGGLSAETITLNEMSTGASNDLARATEIARSMVTQYGMSEELGPVTYKKYGSSFISHEAYALKEYGEAIADKIDSEIRRLIDRARSRAEKILNEKRDQLMKVAGALLEKEYIEGEELTALLNGKPPA